MAMTTMGLEPTSTVGPVTADELCQLYAPLVCRFASLMAPTPHDAEDLAQESLLRAVRGLPSFDPRRGTPKAWLWRIVANAANDAASRRQRLNDLIVRLRILSPPETESIEDAAIMQIRDGELRALLARLPLRDRRLLALRYGADLGPAEIADVLGLTTPTASRAIRRALARLRLLCKETLQ